MDERLRQLINLGRDHYQSGEFDAAEKYLSQAAAEHVGYADVYNMLGVIHHRQNRFAQARAAFEEALRINPGYTEAALNLAVTCNDLGEYAEGRSVYQRALSRSRSEPRSLDPFARGKIANMHADLGAAYAGLGMYPEAIREYLLALELGPTFVDVRTRLANVYRDAGDRDAAVRELVRVRDTHPGFVPARLSLGLAFYSQGLRDEAQKEWDAVLALDPTNRAAGAYLRMTREDSSPPAAAAAPARAPAVAPEGDVDAILKIGEILSGIERGK